MPLTSRNNHFARREKAMNDPTSAKNPSPKDQLNSRPDEPLPTTLDPGSPKARNQQVDPKKVPKTGQGDPDATDPAPDDIGRTA
jgi:hypothetical protein